MSEQNLKFLYITRRGTRLVHGNVSLSVEKYRLLLRSIHRATAHLLYSNHVIVTKSVCLLRRFFSLYRLTFRYSKDLKKYCNDWISTKVVFDFIFLRFRPFSFLISEQNWYINRPMLSEYFSFYRPLSNLLLLDRRYIYMRVCYSKKTKLPHHEYSLFQAGLNQAVFNS